MDLRGVTTPGTHSPKLSAALEQGAPCRTPQTDRWPRRMTAHSARRSHAPDAAPSATEIHQKPPGVLLHPNTGTRQKR
jgi:hypothetical protein